MRTTTIAFGGALLALCATCGFAQQDQSNSPQHVPAAQNPNLAPASTAGAMPGSGMVNSGNGLSQNMTPRQASGMFDHLDINHDGFIDRDEFTRQGDSGQRMPGCDSDGDGKLNRAEFMNCAQKPATQSDSQGQ
jgi:hypothetical protein